MKDRPIKGIGLMVFAVFLIITMNMFGKMASALHNPVEIVFWRNLVALVIVLTIIIGARNFSLLRTTRLKDQLVRGISGTIGLGMVFWAYSLMPMADVVAIMFTSGLMTTGLSAIWLREKVGIYRWTAVAFGFIGALITAAPSGQDWDMLGVFVALGAAFIGGSVVSTMLRSLGKTEPALTTVFYFLVIGLAMSFPYVAYAGKMPDVQTFWPLVGCGVAGGLSLILKTQAFRYAEASLLSPIQYTSIIWATLLGWLVWNDLPALNVIIGAAIIIISNVFIVWREQRRSYAKPSTGLTLPE